MIDMPGRGRLDSLVIGPRVSNRFASAEASLHDGAWLSPVPCTVAGLATEIGDHHRVARSLIISGWLGRSWAHSKCGWLCTGGRPWVGRTSIAYQMPGPVRRAWMDQVAPLNIEVWLGKSVTRFSRGCVLRPGLAPHRADGKCLQGVSWNNCKQGHPARTN